MQSDYKTSQEKLLEISSLPERSLDNFVCNADKFIENEEMKKHLQKECSALRIIQKKKRESYKKSKCLDKLALELLKCHSTERQLFEVNSSRGPLVTFAPGVLPHSIHLVFNDLCVPLEKLEKGGVFNDKEYLGCWCAKKTNTEHGEFLEFRIEFLKINELKEFMKKKFHVDVQLKNLVFEFSTNYGVFLSPPFDITSKLILKSTKRVAIYVESTQCFFYALPSSKDQTPEEIQTPNNVQTLSNQDFVSPFNREDAIFHTRLPNSFTSDKTSSDFQDESIPYFLLTPEQIFSSEILQTQVPSDFDATLPQTQNPSDFNETLLQTQNQFDFNATLPQTQNQFDFGETLLQTQNQFDFDETYFDFSLSNEVELNFELETQV